MRPRFNVVKTVILLSHLTRRRAPRASHSTGGVGRNALFFLWRPLTQHGLYSHFSLTPGGPLGVLSHRPLAAWGGYGNLYGATGAYLIFPGPRHLVGAVGGPNTGSRNDGGFPLHDSVIRLRGCCSGPMRSCSGARRSSHSTRSRSAWVCTAPDERRCVCCSGSPGLAAPRCLGASGDAIAIALAVYAQINVMDGRST